MPDKFDPPVLYSVTLQRPSAISACVVGQFSESKTQLLIVARGSWLEVLRPDLDLAKLVSICKVNVFATIRGLAAFKIAGTGKDLLVMTSDSGRISVLSFEASKNNFKLLNLETFGNSAIRRTIPGEYLACDPKGRAVMIGSIEKTKYVYVLNRDEANNVHISSPLEALASRTICYTIIGVDVGYDNPIFAAIEGVYSDGNEPAHKRLTWYELDLGLNHVVRKWTQPVHFSASSLIALPGGSDGPSGVLLCADNNLTYFHPDQPEINLVLPKRDLSGIPNGTPTGTDDTYIVSSAIQKMKSSFFLLLQNNFGDVFKVSFSLGEKTHARSGGRAFVQSIELQLFASIPLATEMSVFKSGFLFVATGAGDQLFYQFNSLGDDDDVQVFSSLDKTDAGYVPQELDNISLADSMAAINPIVSSSILNLRKDETPQIYAACGTGSSSSLRTLEYGLEVTELVASDLPAAPLAVFTTKTSQSDEFDKYIVISFANETMVLSIGDEVTEVSDSGLQKQVSTLAVQQIGPSSLVQIHHRGLVHLKDGKTTEWTPPGGATIVKCATNTNQVLLALSTHELVYFESDDDGMLIEYSRRPKMSAAIAAVAMGAVPVGRVRSLFCAVACQDKTVRLISLDLDSTLEELSEQALSAPASALRIQTTKSDGQFLHIGLENGVYIEAVLDPVSAELTGTRTRFLGPVAVKLADAWTAEDKELSVLALSTKPWLCFRSGQSFDMTPLAYNRLSSAHPFSSADLPRGIVAASGRQLQIFQVERSRDHVRQSIVPLQRTPRRVANNSFTTLFYVLAGDKQRSEIAVVDTVKSQRVLSTMKLPERASGTSLCNCKFQSRSKEYLAVGVAYDLVQEPGKAQTWSRAEILIYEYSGSPFGSELELVHATAVDRPPLAMTGFKGSLLAGIGGTLVLFDIGLKQLLRKASQKVTGFSGISGLATMRNRVVVGDVKRSVAFVAYAANEGLFIPVADDAVARPATSLLLLDYDTVAVGDKFGNMAVLRCPKQVSELTDVEDQMAVLLQSKEPNMNGCPYKLDLVCQFYLGDSVTGLNKGTFANGGFEALIWTGIQGSLGAFVPIISQADAKFFQQLEHELRVALPSTANLAGRDHLAWRGYYGPPRQVIDGDLCEQFAFLEHGAQEQIAEHLERTVAEIERKVAEFRIRSVF